MAHQYSAIKTVIRILCVAGAKLVSAAAGRKGLIEEFIKITYEIITLRDGGGTCVWWGGKGWMKSDCGCGFFDAFGIYDDWKN